MRNVFLFVNYLIICMNTKDVILLVCSFMLGVVASNLFFKRKYDCTYKVITNVDTLYLQNVDTIFQKDIEYITEKVVDTLYITNVVDSVVKLPMTQKHYTKDSLYDAWVSGYEPSLDSIRVYGKTETRFVTETKTIEKNSSRLNIYPYVGVFSHDNKIGERIGIAISTKKGLYVGADVGYSNKNISYGCNVGFNIK